MNEINCLACKGLSIDFFAKKNGCDLFRCRRCGLIFVWPIIDEYQKIYDEDYFSGEKNKLGYADYEGDWEITADIFRLYLKKLEKTSPNKGKLLDVGAATGHFVQIAGCDGWEASGIEISEYAAEIGRKKGLDIRTGNFENLDLPENSFDMITFWDVLEHFARPDLAIRQAGKMLKSGGLLAVNTPDTASLLARIFGRRWHQLVPPNHLYFFNPRNLELQLRKNNFEILQIGRVGKKFSLRTIFKVLANWQNFFLWKKISNYLLKSRLGNLGFPVNTRDNFFLVARKRN
jgi:2-polyprenyl-3-methyl-5-hydroxy-6-metoxy-1,4-benzoquinol methylase